MQRRSFIKKALSAAAGLLAVSTVAAAGGGDTSSAGAAHCCEPAPGYGKCSRCSCERFDARGNTCRCGHGFYQHHV